MQVGGPVGGWGRQDAQGQPKRLPLISGAARTIAPRLLPPLRALSPPLHRPPTTTLTPPLPPPHTMSTVPPRHPRGQSHPAPLRHPPHTQAGRQPPRARPPPCRLTHLTQRPVKRETRATASVTPALGPSLGTAPAGRCTCTSQQREGQAGPPGRPKARACARTQLQAQG